MTDGTSPFLERVIAAYSKGTSDRLYSDDMWPEMLREAEKVIALAEAKPPCAILDLACGSGATTVAFALMGFRVTGLDCTPASLDIARRMSGLKGADVEWLCQDMRDIEYEDEFDHVFLRDVIFGIFEDEREDLDLIGRMARAVRLNGRCLFEVYNKEFALVHGIERTHFYDEKTGRFADKNDEARWCKPKLYSHDEWEQMLATHDLIITKQDGWNWKGDPDPPPWRADYIVARKRSG